MLIHWIIQSLIAWLLDMVVAVLSILSSAFNNAMALKGEDTLELFFRLFLPNRTGSGSPVTFLTGVGMLILYIIFLFQVFKSYFAPLGVKSEHPIRLLLKTLIFMVLVVEAPNICYMFFNVGTAPYNFFLNEAQWEGGSTLQDLAGWASGLNKSMVSSVGSAVPGNIDGVSKSVLGLVEDVLCIVMLFSILINFVKLIIEVAERYVILGVLSIFSPLCIATGVSDATSSILKKWIQAMISQVILMCMSVFFLSSFQVAAGKITTTGDITGEHGIFIGMVLLLAWLRTGQRIDSHMGTLGLGALQAGGGLYGDMFAGAALAHSAGKAIGSGASIGMNARNAMKSGGVKSASQALKGAFAFHAAQNGGALGGAIAGNMLSKADAGTRAAFNHAVNNSSIKGLSRQRVGEAERNAAKNNPKAAEAMSSVENKVGKMKEGWSIDPNTGMYRGSYIAPDGQEVGLQIDKEGNISVASVNGEPPSKENPLSSANDEDIKSLAGADALAPNLAEDANMQQGYIDENGNFQELPEGGKIEDGIAYDENEQPLGDAAYQSPEESPPSTYIDQNTGEIKDIPDGAYINSDNMVHGKDENGEDIVLGSAGSYMYDDGEGNIKEAPVGSTVQGGMVIGENENILGAAVVKGKDNSFQALSSISYESQDGKLMSAPAGSTINENGDLIAPNGKNLGAALAVGEDGTLQQLNSGAGGIHYDDGKGNMVLAPGNATVDESGNVITQNGETLGAAIVTGKDGSKQHLVSENGGLQYQGANGNAISAPAGSTFDPKTGMIKDANNNVLGAAMVSTANGTGTQTVSSSSGGLHYQGANGNAISAPAGSTFDPKTGMIKDANNNVLGAAMVSTANGTGTQTVSSGKGGAYTSAYSSNQGSSIGIKANASELGLTPGSQFLDANNNVIIPSGSTMRTDSSGITHVTTKDGSETISFAKKVAGTREINGSSHAEVNGVACSMYYSGSPSNANLTPAIKGNLDTTSIRASRTPVSSDSIRNNPNAMYLIKDSEKKQYGEYRQATAQEVNQAIASGESDTGLRVAEGKYISSVGGEKYGTVQLRNGQIQKTTTFKDPTMKSLGYTSEQRVDGIQTFINKNSGKVLMSIDASKHNVSGNGVSTRIIDGRKVYQVEGQYNKNTEKATYSNVRISKRIATFAGGNITPNPAPRKDNGKGPGKKPIKNK